MLTVATSCNRRARRRPPDAGPRGRQWEGSFWLHPAVRGRQRVRPLSWSKPTFGPNINNETVQLHYDDTWGFALGVQYAFADGWLWSVGGGFDSSPVSKSNRSPALPMDQQFRIGTGVQYSFNENVTVGAAYQYMNGGDNSIDVERGPLAGRLEGDYKSFDFHFVGLNLIWRFGAPGA